VLEELGETRNARKAENRAQHRPVRARR